MDVVGQDSGWCLFNVFLDSSSRAAVDQGYFEIDDEKRQSSQGDGEERAQGGREMDGCVGQDVIIERDDGSKAG